MTRDQLIRRLRKIARTRGVEVEIDTQRGKGSHWVVAFDGIAQTPPGGDLRTGLFRSVLKTWGIDPEDL